MELKKAQKKKVKLKIGMSGASGYGKTYSALLLAYGITGDWSKIAIIDTENGSGSLYSDLGEYNTIDLKAPFSPERYIEAIKTCEAAGIEACIIDSISHEWDCEGGCLEIAENITNASNSKNSYAAWAKVTPRHKAFINAILQSNMHIITTVRRKQDYEMVKNDKGKVEVQKVGTKEITREGFEYEITINFEFQSASHMVTASKDRTSLFDKKDPFIITPQTGIELMKWANSGIDEVKFTIESINNCQSREEATTLWNNNKHLHSNPEIIAAIKRICEKYPAAKLETAKQPEAAKTVQSKSTLPALDNESFTRFIAQLESEANMFERKKMVAFLKTKNKLTNSELAIISKLID